MFDRGRDGLSQVQNVLVDGGYTGKPFATAVQGLLGAAVEVVKRNELHTFVVLPKRWVVERSFAWLEKCRRLWKNCERKLNTSLQMVVLAFTVLILKRLQTGSNNTYVLTVEAWDGTSEKVTLAVTVTVTDVDEAGTITLPSAAILTDPDGSISGTTWVRARSSDWDPSAGTGAWSDISSATLPSYTPVTADVGNFLRMTASYTDGHGSGKSAQGVSAYRVLATAPANTAPEFASDTDSRSVAENSAAGTDVGSAVTATDAGDTLTYSLSGMDAASFAIGRATGQITVGIGTSLDYETKNSYEVTVTATDTLNATDTITVTITVTNVNEAPTVVVPVGAETNAVALGGRVTVEFPQGASTGTPFQVRVDDAADQDCTNLPSGQVTVACVQVDLVKLDGTDWDTADGMPFTSANLIIYVSNTQDISVYRRDDPIGSWTSIPPCAGSTGECFTVSGCVVTIQNIQKFSQFAVLRPRPSPPAVTPTATATPPPTVIPPPTPGGGGAATITRRRRGGSIVRATATPAPVMVATPAPTEMAVPATDTPVPTSVASSAVPQTPLLPTVVQPPAAPTTSEPTPTAAIVAPAPTDTPAAVAAIPNTPVPAATTAVPPAVEPASGFPLWLIAAIVVAVVIAGGLGFGAWRMLRPQ